MGWLPRLEVALDHQADDRAVALADLVHAVGHHERLQLGSFERVGVRAVDDDVRRGASPWRAPARRARRYRVVVRPPAAAAQHEVPVAVAARAHDRGRAPAR